MPTIKMCANPALQQTHHRFMIYQPQTCAGEAEKVANIHREIKALKETKQEYLRENTKLGRLNKGLLGARLIKETCYSFLDLTAAFAGDILNTVDKTGLSGKKVEITATALMSTMDMSEAVTNVAYGQGTWGNVVDTYTRSTVSVFSVLAENPAHKAYSHVATQGIHTYDLGRGSLGGQPDQTRQALENMSFDNATYVLDTISENLSGDVATGISGLSSAVKTVKASRRYSQALDKALEEYRLSQEDTQRSRQVIKDNMENSIARLQSALEEAERAYHRCMRPGGPFPLG